MVKQGFLNLTPGEQQNIIDAAIQEFANKDYESASFNQIIANANISKGSMYHYFHNKEDLFMYVIEIVMQEKKRYLTAGLSEIKTPLHELGLFDTLALQLNVSIRFASDNPYYHFLGMQLQNMPNSPLKKKIWGRLNTELERYLASMVNGAITAGELRSDFDRGFIMRLLKFVLLNVSEIFPATISQNDLNYEALERDLAQLVAFLRTGLQKTIREEEL